MLNIKFRGKFDGEWDYATPEDDHWEQFWALIDKDTVGQFIGLEDRNKKEIYDGDIIASKSKEVFHFIDRKNCKPESGIWIDKQDGINITPSFTEKVIYGRKCKIVEWQDFFTGFYPFADSPENCRHCGGGDMPNDFEIVGNIHDNPELLTTK
jgi:uncharacterized phage protein (TIGR01671 family)